MNDFLLALSVILPLVIYMTIGNLIRRFSIFSADNFKTLNNLIFKVFIPLTLFISVSHADLKETLKPDLFFLIFLQIIFLYFVTIYFVPRIVRNKKDSLTITQGIFRSNFVLFGTTIADSLCGDTGIALVSALSAMVVPLFNVLTVIMFESNSGEAVSMLHLLKNIAKNPLIEAGILGIVFNLLHIRIPVFLIEPLQNLSNISTPLALVTLGGILSINSIVRHRNYLIFVSAIHLIAVPFFMLLIGVLLGYRNEALIIILAVFASPVAVASAPMAQTMGGNGELAGEIVATTSILCIFTLFLFIFGMSQARLI